MRVIRMWGLWLSLVLMMLGLVLPTWFDSIHIFPWILTTATPSSLTGNQLMMATFILVALNTTRVLPQYLGAFLLGEQIGRLYSKNYIKWLIPLLIIPPGYSVINYFNAAKFNFGGPAVLAMMAIVLLQWLTRKYHVNMALKSLVLSQVVIGLQWLDVVPFLTSLGFGHGPLSMRAKELSIWMGFDRVLGVYALALCLIFLINAMIILAFVIMYLQKWQVTQTLFQFRRGAIESRADREVLHLMHDLKTPLTAIEGLNSLIELRVKDSKIHEYSAKISESIRSMGEMISEILYADRKDFVDLSSLFNYVRATLSSDIKQVLEINFSNSMNEYLWINKIRMTRALVNLISNAYDSIAGKPDGKIVLGAYRMTSENQVCLSVADNGVGIKSRELNQIWLAGYSTKRHAGVGLSFVKQVVENHHGSTIIHSEEGRGTTVLIRLPRGEESYEQNINRG